MKNCYLHIGNFKTGSTSLQSFLYLNKEILREYNIQSIEEKNYFKKTIHNQNLYKLFDKKDFSKIKKYFSKIKKNSNVILSSEFFSCFSYNLKKIEYVKKTISKLGFNPVIIFYYRCDGAYLYSLYAQQLTQKKNIKIESVFDFKKKIQKFHFYRNKKNKFYFMSQDYNLNNKKIVENWKKIFKKNFFFIKFEKNSGKKLFYDFLNILKLPKKIQFEFPNKKNVSRKIKPWNLKRIFFYIYLKFAQKQIFTNNQLDLK